MRSRFFSLSSVLSTILFGATMLMTSPAFARFWFFWPPAPKSVPEIDPAGLVAAATLLVGGLVVARGHRRKD